MALFRWIEINYGQFWAFGAVGALLVVIAAICAGLAAAKLNRPPPHFPSLTSRLRVAIKANPLEPDQIEAARDTAASILLAPRRHRAAHHRRGGHGPDAEQQEHSGRPDRDGDLAGLGGGAAAAAGATNGRLMSRARSEHPGQSAADRGDDDPDPDRAALFSGRQPRQLLRCSRSAAAHARMLELVASTVAAASRNPFGIPLGGLEGHSVAHL